MEDMRKAHIHELEFVQRKEHQRCWAEWSVKTLRFLKPVLSIEDKIVLSDKNLQETNLAIVLNVMTDLSHHYAANRLIGRLLQPRFGVTA